ncbi:hypothetical protein CHU98_g4725 [Xylaria longipes]|nr:hypothetical protein CHU98_g4725 [Xylaria longipes]
MEQNVQNAVDYVSRFPTAKIATVARQYGITRAVLRNRLAGRGGPNRPPPTNLKLNPVEERAICNYIDQLDRISPAARAEFIREAANRILKAKAHPSDPNPPTVGVRWVARFLKRHGYHQGLQERLDPNREASEDIEVVQTPTTVRQINKAASHIVQAIADTEDINPDLAIALNRFIKGSILNAAELLQVRTDLSRTRLAEGVSQARRPAKNSPLQSGEVLTVAKGRNKGRQVGEIDIKKARRLVEAAEQHFVKATKRAFEEAAKTARFWRLSGRLKPAEIIDNNEGPRLLRRF